MSRLQLEQTSRALVWSLLAVACLRLAVASLVDFDIWFHLAGGEYLFRHGHPPRTDTYSFPSAGQPYICLHWLFQGFVAAAHALFGETGLMLAKAFLILSVAGSFVRACNLKLSDGSLVLASLVLTGCSAALNLRPVLLSLVYLCGCYWVWRSGRTPWLFPVILLLWVNTHGLFVLGLFVAGLWMLEAPRNRAPVFVASLAVCFLNPYGLDGVLFPLVLYERIGGQNVYSANIAEFTSAFRGGFYLHHPAGWAGIALLAGGLAASLHAWKRQGARRRFFLLLMLLAGFGFLYLRAIRNLPLFAVTAGWTIPMLVPSIREWTFPRRFWRFAAAAAAVALVLAWRVKQAATGYPGVMRHHHAEKRLGRLASYTVPRQAARFLQACDWEGKLFNDFNWGGYLLYAMQGDARVFIDPRLEVHSRDLFQQYIRVTRNPAQFGELDANYDFDIAFFSYYPFRGMPGLFSRLSRAPNWQLVYADAFACIFAKDRPVNRCLLENKESSSPPAPDMAPLRSRYLSAGLDGHGWLSPLPLTAVYRDAGWGHFALFRGQTSDALGFLLRASLRAPEIGDLHFFVASAALAAGDEELFVNAYRNLAVVQPSHPERAELHRAARHFEAFGL